MTVDVLSSVGPTSLLSQTIVHTGDPIARVSWWFETFSFVADGTQATIRFTDNFVPPAYYTDSMIDTVSVDPTPLPATLPLFATGLGALGLLGWRRKRNAAAIAA
jgi:hypothetical protein